MKNFLFLATIIVVFIFVPKIVFGAVVINEITWMGTQTDYNDEWIELYNDSDQQVELTGWILEAVDGQPKINLSGIISANGYFLLERTNDDSVPGIVADQIYTGALGNSGEYLKLKDNSNNIIDEVNCSSGWLAGDNSTKQTMERTTTGWQTSLNSGGTPKTQNSSGAPEEPESIPEKPKTPTIPIGNKPPIAEAGDNIIAFIGQEIKFDGTKSTDPEGSELAYSWNMGDGKLIEKPFFTYKYNYPGTYLVTLMVYDGQYYTTDTIEIKIQAGQIIINEFLPNPSGKDEEEEWIEIYNDSDSIVDISGWQLDDIASGSKPFIFPKNTLIAPKSYIVFSRQITSITLNNDKDSVRLLLPEEIIFQEINYENPPLGKSSARTEEGFIWSLPTPGAINLSIGASGVSTAEKNFIYQQPIKSELTKESSQDYAINYQNANKPEIEGGYAVIPAEELQKQSEENQLATVKGFYSQQNSTQLILILALIISVALIVGLLLVKFRKKYP